MKAELRNYRCTLLGCLSGLNPQEKPVILKLLGKIEAVSWQPGEEPLLTDGQSRIVRLIWYAFLTLLVIGTVVLAFHSLASTGHAATITISDIGNSTGHGLHSVSYSGQNLTAIIAQGMNNSTWQINASGAI